MSAPQHTIVVMRHAKAEAMAGTDADRELTERGRRDAEDAGRWLAGRGLLADVALVSAAARTGQTWQHLAAGAGWDLAPERDRGLYAAGVETALDLVRRQDDAIATVLLLGHNPTVASLAQLLDDGEAEGDVVADMVLGFPPCALAVFSYAGRWSDLGVGAARLTAFHVGGA